MAFTEQTFFNGTVASQQLGKHISIEGQYMAASGVDTSDVNVYKKGADGEWGFLVNATSSFADNVLAGSAIVLFKTNLYTSNSETSQVVNLYKSSNDFSTVAASFTQTVPIDGFGDSLAVSDNYIAVGVPSYDSNNGSVYLYTKVEGSSWITATEDFIITPDLPFEDELFGTSVAINENFLIVGAPGYNSSRGAIYVFERNEGTGVWEYVSRLLASDGSTGDQFGGTLSLSGDYFAVGAEFADLSEDEINAGAVYLFKYSTSSNSWYEIKKITGIDETDLSGNHFGHSINLKDDYLIVGSPDARSQGVVDVFYKKRDWIHLKKINSSNIASADSFGESVGIDYPNLVVGAHETTTNLGRVYLFEDPAIRLRLAQEFNTDNKFLPSKASVYLKRAGKNEFNYWPIYNTQKTVIDATNFSTIDQADTDSTITFNVNEFQKLKASDAATNDYFGYVVDVDGEYMVVGAYRESNYQGAAYIFYNDPDNPSDDWVEIKKLTASDGVADDYFGISVAIDGDYVVVGAYLNDDAEIGLDTGAAYVFYRNPENPSNEWNEIKKLTASDARAGDQFGRGVSVSGNYVVVGAPEIDEPYNNVGAAYIFSIDLSNPSNECGEIQKIQPSIPENGERFGRQVAIEGNYIVVGARMKDGLVANTGAAYVFYREPDNPSNSRWEQIKELTASDGAGDDYFGEAVSISGDYIIIGAYQEDEKGVQAGAAYIYYKNQGGLDNWGEIQKLTASDGSASDRFGWSVSIDGDYAVVGADGEGSNKAGVYVFNKYSNNNWMEVKKLVARDVEDTDYFGSGVSISGDCIVVGAYFEDEIAANSGAAYVFYIEDPTYTGSNIVIFDDEIRGFTGNGYMITQDELYPASDFSTINYPIRAIVDDTYQLWLRCYSSSFDNPSSSGSFTADILIDGEVIRTISESLIYDEWSWFQTDIVLPDTNEHILGIKLKENGNIVDKIYIDVDATAVPEGEGPYSSVSSYLTVHMKMYDAEDTTYPSSQIFAYDYKTTIDEIVQDDWYNFNISVLGRDMNVNPSSSYPIDNYFIVLTSSGDNPNNYIIWEMLNTDEYMGLLSAITISPGLASENISLTPLDYYKARIGDSDLEEDKWYINYNKRHAFKIYSDYDPIEDV